MVIQLPPSLAFPLEVAAIIHGKTIRYTPMWYGTDDERETIRELITEWAENNNADVLIFFSATEWFHRPPARLQRVGKKTDEQEESTDDTAD
ncbi:hypothetical protein [Alicyclobacillus herbarius]|uniref:hypothetical protein n=1 Tax=Alicyclobacillus herbarius TaxID=122960 RepID=UPI00047B8F6D|nr:hypothetical protein [Alicyclobacillus herbarius]